MKNFFIFFMNILFVMGITADILSIKYDCKTTLPIVVKSTYQQIQAQQEPTVQTADIYVPLGLKL